MNLKELVNAINSAEQSIQCDLRTTIETAVQIGKWLIEAKQQLPHGEFQAWCRANLRVKERMVRYYMQLAKSPVQTIKFKSIQDFARLCMQTNKAARHEECQAYVAEAIANLPPVQSNWQIHEADNRLFEWPAVDHIWTDPPWPSTQEALDSYKWLASMAYQNLKDSGLLAVQCGQTDFAKVLPLFQQFHYVTTLAIVYHQSCNKMANCFLPNWRPVLLFAKGKFCPKGPVTDTITVRNNYLVKAYHPWQQPLEPFVRWIPALTKPGVVVADPFACTGTIALACKLSGRRFIGTELDPNMVAVARRRLAEC